MIVYALGALCECLSYFLVTDVAIAIAACACVSIAWLLVWRLMGVRQ